MILTHEKLRIPDENKEKDFFVEVNWNPHDRKTNRCKLLRFIFPNGDEAIVKREHFHAILFTISEQAEQRKMVPQTITRIRNYETILGITATKKIERGEKINVHVKIPIPLTQDDVLVGSKRR